MHDDKNDDENDDAETWCYGASTGRCLTSPGFAWPALPARIGCLLPHYRKHSRHGIPFLDRLRPEQRMKGDCQEWRLRPGEHHLSAPARTLLFSLVGDKWKLPHRQIEIKIEIKNLNLGRSGQHVGAEGEMHGRVCLENTRRVRCPSLRFNTQEMEICGVFFSLFAFFQPPRGMATGTEKAHCMLRC